MEQIKKQLPAHSEWKAMLHAPTVGQAVLVAALFFLSCLILPITDHAVVAQLYTVLCAVFCYLLLRSFRGLLLYALPAFVLYMLSGIVPSIQSPITLTAAFLTILVGGSCGGFFLTHYHSPRKYPFILLLPPSAYGIATWVTGDPLRGLLTLIPLAVAIVTAICLLRLIERPTATALIAGTLAATLAIAGLITLAAIGALHGNPVVAMGDHLRSGILDRFWQIQAMYEELQPLYAEMGVDLALPEIDYQAVADMLVNIFPGIFLALCAVTGFFVWRLLVQQLVAFQSTNRLPFQLVAFTVSRVGALLFVFCGLVAIFASELTAFSAICLNLAIVTAPGLALIGFTSLFTRGRSCLSLLLAIGLLFLVFRNPISGLMVAAFLGAFQILFIRFVPSPDDPDNHDKGEN
ncbi:MAG: hypothetical protein E7585_03775 [Ruminococcaceae bacterium]|nr:hypothetical protein [Oscillospiraceae bacterium]